MTGALTWTTSDVAVDLKILHSDTNGQIGQLRHFFMPFSWRDFLTFFGGNFDLISLVRRLGGTRYATSGGAEKTSLR